MLGGGPFGPVLQQGFVTGLSLQPNAYDHGGAANAAQMLAQAKDLIQAGMAANLREYVLTNSQGRQVRGVDMCTYGGVPVAYAVCPTESVKYVFAHDNETLFDIVSVG